MVFQSSFRVVNLCGSKVTLITYLKVITAIKAHNSVSNPNYTNDHTYRHLHEEHDVFHAFKCTKSYTISHHDRRFLPLLIHPHIRGILRCSTISWPKLGHQTNYSTNSCFSRFYGIAALSSNVPSLTNYTISVTNVIATHANSPQ